MYYKDRLRKLREDNNLSSRDIDKILNLNIDTYKVFENEGTMIPIEHLNTLSNYFNVSLDYIFDFTTLENYDIVSSNIDKELTGKRLREIRKEMKLTQESLSDKLKIVRQTISLYEKGKSIIATPYLYTICNMYGISADYLLGKTNEPKYWK